MTKKVKNKETFIEVFFKKNANISETCKSIGISRQCFYNWKNDDDEFAEQVHEIQESMIDFAESKLLENIKDNKETSIIFFLKTKGKSRGYTERQEIEHQGKNVSIDIQIEKPE